MSASSAGLRSHGLLLVGVLLCAVPLRGQDDELSIVLQKGLQHLDRGNLTSASRAFEEILDAAEEPGPGRPSAQLVLAARAGACEVSFRRGAYADVVRELVQLPAEVQRQPALSVLAARAMAAVGSYTEAEATLRAALLDAPKDCELRYRLGEVLWLDGRRSAGRDVWREVAADQRPADVRGLTFLGRCHLALGERPNFEAGSQALVDALKLDRSNAEARTALGEMNFLAFREAAGRESGEPHLKKVLDEHGDFEDALLALFRLRISNFQLDPSKTEQLLDRVLTQNQHSVPGLLERARLLLADRRIGEGAAVLEQALQINPKHRVVLCHRAAAAFLLNNTKSYGAFRERALAGDPGWGELDRVLGDHLVGLYRFADAVPFYETSLAAEPKHVGTLQGLAKARIYCGQGEQAHKLLVQAKEIAAGLHDPWRHNAMAVQELLAKEYEVVSDDKFALHFHRDDRELLATYLVPTHLKALEVLGAKYNYRPTQQVRVEVFHTWDDFSVRTIGFRGFTALGACFGPFVTLVSPGDSDVRKLDFMWEATVWHEFTHVLTLGLSRHRVPRWLTEGFSVYEEKARDASWERGMDRELFDNFHNQDIPPVVLLNRLFRGPRIMFGYYQGGLIVELIARDFGFQKATDLLAGYADDLDSEAVFQKALGISAAEFDKRLLQFVERDKLKGMRLQPRWNDAALARLHAKAAAAPGDASVHVDLAWAYLQRDNIVDAGRFLADALRRDPASGRALLVRAHLLLRRGEIPAALELWQRAFASGADDFDSRIACGRALQQGGDTAGAEQQYQRAKACWPACTEQQNAPELLLAKLYQADGREEQARMELTAYCKRTARAYAPRFELAKAEREGGHREAELRWLVECNRIDPFTRELHVRMGEALEALERKAEAAREFAMAAAVMPALERNPPRGEEPVDPAADVVTQAELRLKAARLYAAARDLPTARAWCERVIKDAASAATTTQAKELLEEWRGR